MRMDARAEEWANELAELRAIVERLARMAGEYDDEA